MSPNYKNSFRAYNETVGQCFSDSQLAAEYGALGIVIKFLTTAVDDFTHTGTIGIFK